MLSSVPVRGASSPPPHPDPSKSGEIAALRCADHLLLPRSDEDTRPPCCRGAPGVRIPAIGGTRARRVPRDAWPAADDPAGGAALGARPAVVRGGRRRPRPKRVPAANRVRGGGASRRLAAPPVARTGCARQRPTQPSAVWHVPTFVSETSRSCYHACHDALTFVDVLSGRALFQLRRRGRLRRDVRRRRRPAPIRAPLR